MDLGCLEAPLACCPHGCIQVLRLLRAPAPARRAAEMPQVFLEGSDMNVTRLAGKPSAMPCSLGWGGGWAVMCGGGAACGAAAGPAAGGAVLQKRPLRLASHALRD